MSFALMLSSAGLSSAGMAAVVVAAAFRVFGPAAPGRRGGEEDGRSGWSPR